jgi:hypothetical protein
MSDSTRFPADSERLPFHPSSDELRRQVQTPGPWSRRFRRLVRAASAIDPTTCVQCREMLDVYVDEERRNGDAPGKYPHIYRHLQTCPDCAHDHAVLLDALKHASAADPVPAAVQPPLSFLQLPHREGQWFSRPRSRLNGDRLGVDFVLDIDYLKQRFGRGPMPHLRSAPVYRSGPASVDAPSGWLLMGNVPFDELQLNVAIHAEPDRQHPEWLSLFATLTGSANLPDNLWMRLTWADRTYRVRVQLTGLDAGEARIDEIPLGILHDTPDSGERRFEIGIESGDADYDDDVAPGT